MKKQKQELENQSADSTKTILGDQKGAVATATSSPKASRSKSRFTPGLLISTLILFAGVGGYLTFRSFAATIYSTPASNFRWQIVTGISQYSDARYVPGTSWLRVYLTSGGGDMVLFPQNGRYIPSGGRWRVCIVGNTSSTTSGINIRLRTQIGSAPASSDEYVSRSYPVSYYIVNLCTTRMYGAGDRVFPRIHVYSSNSIPDDKTFTLKNVTIEKL